VNYIVENTRVGQMTNYDRITLQIWTDGTVSPDEALRQASDVLVQHFQMIADNVGPQPKPIEGIVEPVAEPQPAPGATHILVPQKIYDTPIEELDLTVRAYNCLKRSGITKVGQVLQMSEDDLLAVRNFGEKSLTELRDSLLTHHFLPTVGQLEQAGMTNGVDHGLDSGLDSGMNGAYAAYDEAGDNMDEMGEMGNAGEEYDDEGFEEE
jgi:DNA-directed RNA polymerase subunit alpha